MKHMKLQHLLPALPWKHITLASIGSIVAACSASAEINLDYCLEGTIIRLDASGTVAAPNATRIQNHYPESALMMSADNNSFLSCAVPGNTDFEFYNVAVSGTLELVADAVYVWLPTWFGTSGADDIFTIAVDTDPGHSTFTCNIGSAAYDPTTELLTVGETVEYYFNTTAEALSVYENLLAAVNSGVGVTRNGDAFVSVSAKAVPEPSEYALMMAVVVLGALGVVRVRRLAVARLLTSSVGG